MSTRAGPSSVSQRPPSTELTAAYPPRAALIAFCEPPLVITRAFPASWSQVNPTATTCGVPFGRNVVSVARWYSPTNFSPSSVRVCCDDGVLEGVSVMPRR